MDKPEMQDLVISRGEFRRASLKDQIAMLEQCDLRDISTKEALASIRRAYDGHSKKLAGALQRVLATFSFELAGFRPHSVRPTEPRVYLFFRNRLPVAAKFAMLFDPVIPAEVQAVFPWLEIQILAPTSRKEPPDWFVAATLAYAEDDVRPAFGLARAMNDLIHDTSSDAISWFAAELPHHALPGFFMRRPAKCTQAEMERKAAISRLMAQINSPGRNLISQLLTPKANLSSRLQQAVTARVAPT